ncbi:MAG TPA: hypothetical protein VH413_16415 [Verrucomicrobiae bacterium]|jgi:hypothetical protein|nr:hypothetical protein [Verrucomicrobiae bacterium]
MATVSETAFGETGLVDFCACCGLRRPLGRLNLDLGADQETVRCVDCFFGPEQPQVFIGEAIYIGAPRQECGFGATGDIVSTPWYGVLFFEPHGNHKAAFDVTEKQLFAFHRYSPKLYSVRSAPEEFETI